jgi:quinol monooxygenase YgiN
MERAARLTPQDTNLTVRVIRYKLKADRVAENERLIRDVFTQLHEKKLVGVKYAVYKLADGVSFVHIISYTTEEAHKAFTSLPAFQAFQAQAKDRFEEAPVTSESEEIGSYSAGGA